MTNELHPGEVLTAETVGLLEAGDLLLLGHIIGAVHEIDPDGQWVTIYRKPDYFSRYPATFTFIGRPNAEGWIDAPEGGWKTNPVPGCRVDVRMRDGLQGTDLSGMYQWTSAARMEDRHSDIVAFRLSASDEGRGSRPSDVPTEPDQIGRFITFNPSGAWGNAVVSPEAPAEGVYWSLIGSGPDGDQNVLAQQIVERLNAVHPQEAASVHGVGVGEKVYVSSALADEMTFLVRRLRQKGDLASSDLLQSYQWRVREIEFATHPAREDGPAGQWQDIATAPKDGTMFLARCGDFQPFECQWDGERFVHFDPDDGAIVYPADKWHPLNRCTSCRGFGYLDQAATTKEPA